MDIEYLVGVLGLNVDAAPVAQQPDEHEDRGGQEQHVREHGHARRHDGVVVAPDDPVRHGCRRSNHLALASKNTTAKWAREATS
uniref:Uncharacterized protein n=1 Tax=Arundo donax TaxID=35708 RepID=A0A0A9H8X8_ARUDO